MLMSDIGFLIIGAAKSATTWLQKSLQADPAVVMPDPELHYFSREFHRGDVWYLSQFPKSEKGQLVGEKSNSYLDTPHAAGRIHEALPHAKLIAQLRNPVDRAYSDYCMLYRRGEVGRDIDSYLDPRFARDRRFLAGGQYSRQLEEYLALYPASQILVRFFEDVEANPAGQLTQLRSFLGIQPNLPGALVGDKVKDKTKPMVSSELRKRLRWLKPAVTPFRSTLIFRQIHGLLAREVEYPELRPDLRKRLAEHYAPEVDALRKLIGKELPAW